MRSYVKMGFDAVKIKVGRVPPVEDAVRVRAAREAVGPNVPLFLDANNAWPDAMTAIQAVRHFEEYEPGWIEEPLMPDDIRGHAEIAAAVSVPVATGEIHATRWEFQQIVDAGGGGHPSGGRRRLRGGDRVAEDSGHGGVQQPGGCPPLARGPATSHLVAATPNATWVEYFPDFAVLNIGRLFSTMPEVRPGGLALPDAPGLGVELDEEAVSRWSVDGWG